AVPQHVEGLAVLLGQDGEGVLAVRDFAIEVDDVAIEFGGDSGLGQALADTLGDVAGPGTGGSLTRGAVGQLQSWHGSPPAKDRRAPTTGPPGTGHAIRARGSSLAEGYRTGIRPRGDSRPCPERGGQVGATGDAPRLCRRSPNLPPRHSQ